MVLVRGFDCCHLLMLRIIACDEGKGFGGLPFTGESRRMAKKKIQQPSIQPGLLILNQPSNLLHFFPIESMRI